MRTLVRSRNKNTGHGATDLPDDGAPPSIGTPRVIIGMFAAVLILLYAPVVAAAARTWVTDDNYSHGVFIFPVAIGLIWMQRNAIRRTPAAPTAWGLIPLGLGLGLEIIGCVLGSNGLAMLSLIPVLSGAALILQGKALWKIVCFPICFLVFAARMPAGLIDPASQWAQNVSTLGSVVVMRALGYPLIQHGNMVEIPGMVLEIAGVCSGFKKLIALVAFSLLYGYVLKTGVLKRVLLAIAAVPIALIANVIRICILIGVSYAGGERAFHMAHDAAELLVLVIAFFLFVLLGRSLGCESTRFSQ